MSDLPFGLHGVMLGARLVLRRQSFSMRRDDGARAPPRAPSHAPVGRAFWFSAAPPAGAASAFVFVAGDFRPVVLAVRAARLPPKAFDVTLTLSRDRRWWRARDRRSYRGAAAWIAARAAARGVDADGAAARACRARQCPAFEIDADAPVLALVGIFRPRLFVTRGVIAALTRRRARGERRARSRALARARQPQAPASCARRRIFRRQRLRARARAASGPSASEHSADRVARRPRRRAAARCALASAHRQSRAHDAAAPPCRADQHARRRRRHRVAGAQPARRWRLAGRDAAPARRMAPRRRSRPGPRGRLRAVLGSCTWRPKCWFTPFRDHLSRLSPAPERRIPAPLHPDPAPVAPALT